MNALLTEEIKFAVHIAPVRDDPALSKLQNHRLRLDSITRYAVAHEGLEGHILHLLMRNIDADFKIRNTLLPDHRI